MNNLTIALKKFMGNKNTVTILGVVLCVIILYVGYNKQISKTADLVRMPVANVDINPRVKITDEMVTMVDVPRRLLNGDFYDSVGDIVGKYTTYNAVVAKGSLFYKRLLITADKMPTAIYSDVKPGYTVINYPVNMNTTYVNTMEPESYIDMYVKYIDENEGLVFGKFLTKIKVLAVKDSSGNNIFEQVEETNDPAYLFFAVPDSIYELLKKAMYISSDYNIEFTLVPHTEVVKEQNAKSITSTDIKDFILNHTKAIDSNKIEDLDTLLAEAEEVVGIDENNAVEQKDTKEENKNNEGN